jgi:RimJ/RimL family protein N-acetyltransferase
MSEPAGPSIGAPSRPTVLVRPVGLLDLRSVMRLYRSQPPASRGLFHPLPFDRLRLSAFLLYVVVTRRSLRWLLHHPPLRATVVLTARRTPREPPIAFGLVGFNRSGPEPRAIFGYLVHEDARGLGIGTRLHEEMIDAAVRIGVKRGGGTVLVSNAPNIHLLQKLGFVLTPTDTTDSAAVGEANLASDGDLVAISNRFHAAAGRPPLGIPR